MSDETISLHFHGFWAHIRLNTMLLSLKQQIRYWVALYLKRLGNYRLLNPYCTPGKLYTKKEGVQINHDVHVSGRRINGCLKSRSMWIKMTLVPWSSPFLGLLKPSCWKWGIISHLKGLFGFVTKVGEGSDRRLIFNFLIGMKLKDRWFLSFWFISYQEVPSQQRYELCAVLLHTAGIDQ